MAGGTSTSSPSASRRGDRRPKGPLVPSCNSPVRSRNRFGPCVCRSRRGRGMCRGVALEAAARKRAEVVYATMGDEAPYAAWRAAPNRREARPLAGPAPALPSRGLSAEIIS